MKVCIGIAALALLAGCAGMRPPHVYPEWEPATSHDAVVVATTQLGDYLPKLPACESKDVICMDPPPFWFRARVLDVVFGSIERTSIVASTTSHYGMGQFGRGSDPSLFRLAVGNGAIIMPRYARAALHADRSGELFVILNGRGPIGWLPCSIIEVAVDIDVAGFADDLLIPAESVAEDEVINEVFFARTEGGFLPRKGLPVSRLAEHLRSRYAGQKLPECRQE